MATGFTRRNYGGNHAYFLDGVKIPGVTSIIGVLDKPALVQWAANMVAEYAVNEWPRLAGLTQIQRYEELKTAHRQSNKKAIVRGNRIHDLAERLAKGEEVEPSEQSLIGAANAYADLIDAWELEPVLTEASVLNHDYQYAGTLDSVMRSPRLGTVLVDNKTGKRVYSEVALQLAAYENADIYLEEIPQVGPRGGKKPSAYLERQMPHVDGAVVIHIQVETETSPATAQLVPVDTGPEIFEQFLYLRELFAGWVERTGYDHRKSENYRPPIGAPIYPEMTDDQIMEAFTL